MQIDAEVLGLSSTVQNVPRFATLLMVLTSVVRSRFWLLCLDLYPVLAAFALPWSTTAVSVLFVLWPITLLPTIDPRAFLASLRRPESFMPVLLFGLALTGMLWADGPWADRLLGLHPVFKLLAIPLLFVQFRRSDRGEWVFAGFALSCVVLLLHSFILVLWPNLPLHFSRDYGVPVKNAAMNAEPLPSALGLARTAMRRRVKNP